MSIFEFRPSQGFFKAFYVLIIESFQIELAIQFTIFHSGSDTI
ncbi:21514_t:CDS:2 [Gigaspora rosea]|nr:21514_t:CDS:2 [Gigaspora rosea]